MFFRANEVTSVLTKKSNGKIQGSDPYSMENSSLPINGWEMKMINKVKEWELLYTTVFMADYNYSLNILHIGWFELQSSFIKDSTMVMESQRWPKSQTV